MSVISALTNAPCSMPHAQYKVGKLCYKCDRSTLDIGISQIFIY
ncbi:MAG: hypothetical protein RMY29_030120 [Nostoc sp. CreGUA01]|nr:hypothetical protein [Nostoc sp. CreGUA01]